MWPQIVMIVLLSLGFSRYCSNVVAEEPAPDDKVAFTVIGLVCLGVFILILAAGGFWSALGWDW